jgi:hypothetical protein
MKVPKGIACREICRECATQIECALFAIENTTKFAGAEGSGATFQCLV